MAGRLGVREGLSEATLSQEWNGETMAGAAKAKGLKSGTDVGFEE